MLGLRSSRKPGVDHGPKMAISHRGVDLVLRTLDDDNNGGVLIQPEIPSLVGCAMTSVRDHDVRLALLEVDVRTVVMEGRDGALRRNSHIRKRHTGRRSGQQQTVSSAKGKSADPLGHEAFRLITCPYAIIRISLGEGTLPYPSPGHVYINFWIRRELPMDYSNLSQIYIKPNDKSHVSSSQNPW